LERPKVSTPAGFAAPKTFRSDAIVTAVVLARDERGHRDRWPTIYRIRPSAINLRIVSCRLFMLDVYLRSIEPLMVIVLGCVCRKGAEAYETATMKKG
jgi:hypothetical protein